MSVPFSYLGVVIIWSSTPLAIQWSSKMGFILGLTGRMTISLCLAVLILLLMRLHLSWSPVARKTYLASGFGIYTAMTSVYWASQYIPSGWIAVVYGLSPILTGILARIWLAESGLTSQRLIAILIALSGLTLVMSEGLVGGDHMLIGIAGVLVSVLFHAGSAVRIKQLNAGLHGLVVTTGGLMIATPLFVMTWLFIGAPVPEILPVKAVYATLYLGVFGSVLGFALYYYVLHHVEATKVALITLITPALALMLGQQLNGEEVGLNLWVGTGLIGVGLLVFEQGGRLLRWVQRVWLWAD